MTVADEQVGAIGPGLLVLLGVEKGDEELLAVRMAAKIGNLRIFEDAGGRMNLSAAEGGGAALVVSQFTLIADVRRGRRPNFSNAAPPDIALALYETFCAALRDQGYTVETGRFRAKMLVSLVNDGPVTLVIDSRDLSA